MQRHPRPRRLVAAAAGAVLLLFLAGPASSVGAATSGQDSLNAVSCQPTDTCVAVGDAATTTSNRQGEVIGGSVSILVYRSTDGGRRWSDVHVPRPPDSQLLDVACTTATSCVAVGSHVAVSDGAWEQTTALAMVTTDGRHWEQAVLPASTPALEAVACPAPSRCTAVGGEREAGTVLMRTAAVVSDDGGVRWSLAGLPTMAGQLQAVSCPTASHCVATGADPYVARGFSTSRAIALTSSNGGVAWRPGSISGSGGPSSLACRSATACVGFGDEFDWCYCGTGVPGHYAALWSSSDGGLSWSEHTLPTVDGLDIWYADGVACPSSAGCLLAASGTTTASAKQYWPLLVTVNAASDWQPGGGQAPRHGAPGGMWDLALWCATPTHCVTVGESFENGVAGAVGHLGQWTAARF